MHAVRRETFILLIGDALLMGLSLWLALLVRTLKAPTYHYYLEHLHAFVFVYLVSLLVFYISGLYERQTRLVKHILSARILGAQIANTALAAIMFFTIPFSIAPKTVLALYLVISVVLISAWRFRIVPALSVGHPVRAVMVGEGSAVNDVLRLIQGNPKYYVQFLAHIEPSTLPSGVLARMVEEQVSRGARLIVIDTRNQRLREELPSLYETMLEGCTFTEFSTFYEELFDRVPSAHIDHSWLLEYLPRQNLTYALAKRTIDVIGALVGIVVAAPFVLIAIIAITLGGGGTAFIRHERIGRNNCAFHIHKLRTMLINDHGDPVLRQKNRVTAVGKVLRKTRIDELPQLWNILRGELSFIGPRPELPALAKVYEAEIPYYDVRHLITPGLSGWAQIHDYDAPRGAADIERTRRKLTYDLYYVKHRSFGLDVAIALKTLRALFSFSGT